MSQRELPVTSLQAHEMVKKEVVRKHHLLILEALQTLGFAMYEDLAIHTGLEKHQVGRRLSELEREGKIYKSGIKRDTASGGSAFCYTLTFGTGIAVSRKERNRKHTGLPLIQQTFL